MKYAKDNNRHILLINADDWLMNIRNKNGNYLRYGGIDIKLAWKLTFEAITKSIIDEVYVNEKYPKRLYFKVHSWDETSPLSKDDLAKISINNFDIDISNS